ncbi:hypothetical protein SOASR030_33250 [Leminorella grimontii]|uniref:5-carboxymethyl-2-hydroxymuconate isomerase n=1 Tax=Leminorella grimontii TaxID=82981 RepID=A0AAV5N6W1_9GAMM|nr:hypothetical protein [Leminorella grimontii]KFC98441.1 putative isomerase [Leminorella grimontii ATCC 33999 = DSM 5078]GKX57213.1 hypothetical protein SOASR030_33250 [Leminorella grimontii]GKX60947.1 hypothetical protein SOASR031_32620 [Leminorella grimontii]VFS55961.1 5-carboxymethyl-2-hydroxymuconate isomerase [Leminorella grimontii]
MPNIHVTYTPNLPAKEKLDDFALQIHSALAPVIASDASNFKTYLIPIAHAVIGLGNKEKAVMHVDFRMFAGRSAAVKQEVAKIILTKAKALFGAAGGIETEITVEVGNLDNDNYHKVIVNQ